MCYKSFEEFEEEAKCLELAVRKFKNHPLYEVIKEHIIYRLHECSQKDREAAYRLSLICILNLKDGLKIPETEKLISSLKKGLEIPYFFDLDENNFNNKTLSIILAFLLAKIPTLLELIEQKLTPCDLFNLLFSLLELGEDVEKLKPKNQEDDSFKLFNIAVNAKKTPLEESFLKSFCKLAPKKLEKKHSRILIYLIQNSFDNLNYKYLEKLFLELKNFEIPPLHKTCLDSLYVKYLLLKKETKKLAEFFSTMNISLLTQEGSSFHFLYGCFLYLTDGKASAFSHFSNILEIPYPPTTSLISHYLTNPENRNKKLLDDAFFWEKKELYRNLSLLYGVTDNIKKQKFFLEKIKKIS